MVTVVNEVETAVEAMRLSAYDCVMKPFMVRGMLLIIDHAITGEGRQFDRGPEPYEFDVPITIFVGTPMEEDHANMGDEILGILEAINSVQEQLTTIANKVDVLLTPKLKVLPALESPTDRVA
jgi:DNA-binding NtrC family response regulator